MEEGVAVQHGMVSTDVDWDALLSATAMGLLRRIDGFVILPTKGWLNSTVWYSPLSPPTSNNLFKSSSVGLWKLKVVLQGALQWKVRIIWDSNQSPILKLPFQPYTVVGKTTPPLVVRVPTGEEDECEILIRNCTKMKTHIIARNFCCWSPTAS